ncbi:hypothetical protein F511_24616 [Dorcoceras hygrometricum]|uniref:Uncharacterized protein n=1 Tax=Dorcoceras hygrometricum TaxID=472368 RepID=A0A2Z7AVJ9_9LAMI|nr:hypothetical protein F511_24616 [Dorcoceras hygrometricum]
MKRRRVEESADGLALMTSSVTSSYSADGLSLAVARISSIGYPRTRVSVNPRQRSIDSYMHRDLTQSRHLMTPAESRAFYGATPFSERGRRDLFCLVGVRKFRPDDVSISVVLRATSIVTRPACMPPRRRGRAAIPHSHLPAGSLATMRRVVNYHSSWARQPQVELFDASGNPSSTAGRGFNPAGGAPGVAIQEEEESQAGAGAMKKSAGALSVDDISSDVIIQQEDTVKYNQQRSFNQQLVFGVGDFKTMSRE